MELKKRFVSFFKKILKVLLLVINEGHTPKQIVEWERTEKLNNLS